MASPFGPLVAISGPGRVRDEIPEVERQLRARRLAYRVHAVDAPGEATQAAREALAAGERFLVVVGGDATVNEVVNGMIEDDRPVAEDAVLGVVGAGSRSDFVRTFGLPDDVVRATRHLAGDRTYRVDAGRVGYRHRERERVRYFINVAQAGLGGAVVHRTARLPRSFGSARHFLGFWLALARYRPREVRVRADRRSFEGRATNVVVANCQFTGGGLKISPRSYPGDGFFDVQVAVGPKSEAFTLLPKLYRGEHVPSPSVRELRGREVEVEAEPPLPVEADGLPLGTTPATFLVLHEAVAVKI